MFILFIAGIAVIVYFASKTIDYDIDEKESTIAFVERESTTAVKKENVTVNAGAVSQTEPIMYFLIYGDGILNIYIGEDMYFYDYAQINWEMLSQDMQTQLLRGMYVEGEQDLYDFLQTYSS
jgi:hypothetical protein